jgi:hypothetical protein
VLGPLIDAANLEPTFTMKLLNLLAIFTLSVTSEFSILNDLGN